MLSASITTRDLQYWLEAVLVWTILNSVSVANEVHILYHVQHFHQKALYLFKNMISHATSSATDISRYLINLGTNFTAVIRLPTNLDVNVKYRSHNNVYPNRAALWTRKIFKYCMYVKAN
jgi:hypothetical protein